MPVARHVLAHAAATPDQVAVVAGDSPALTYAELAARARAASAHLVHDGVRPGQVVAIDLRSAQESSDARRAQASDPHSAQASDPCSAQPSDPRSAQHGVDTLVALLAVDLAGAVALLCDPTWSPEQRGEILAATAPDHHLTALDLTAPALAAPDVATPDLTALDLTTLALLPDPVPVADDDLAWGGFTSGSTGRPRAVVRSRGSWTGSFEAASALTSITAADTVLVPGPLATSLFCFGAVHALAVGASVRLAPSITAALGDLASCDVVHLVPDALSVVLDAFDALEAEIARDPRDTPGGTAAPDAPRAHQGLAHQPSRLRTAVVGGAALPAGTRERAARHGLDVLAYYGATELSFVAVDPDGSGLRPFPGVEIEVRDRTADGSGLGVVWVRSPWVAHGYLAGAAGPLRTADGWATVGDLAELEELVEPSAASAAAATSAPPHGPASGRPSGRTSSPELTPVPSTRLLLRGRGTGAIAVGAATVVPEDVEAVLRPVPGVRAVVVLGTAHPRLGQVVTAVVVAQDGARLDLAALEAASRARLGHAQRPRRWFTTDSLPVTGTGKPARAVVQAALETQDPAYRPVRHGR